MPRSVLRPPAARVVASRAMGTLCRLLEGGLTGPHKKPYISWAVGVFTSYMERIRSAKTVIRKIATTRASSGWTNPENYIRWALS